MAPRKNHWWHVPLYVTARGLSTSPMPFDLIEPILVVNTSDGATRSIALRAQAVADFYRAYVDALDSLGITVKMWPVPVEVDSPIPFADDRRHASYDADQARRFLHMLLHANRVLARFKGRFLGKSSPVHFFWGAFDLALTRFNGRRAPESKEIQSPMLREAMSHEEMEPSGLPAWSVRPTTAYYSRELADFILPYESVRSLASPDDMVLDFFQSVYDAASDLARWDRPTLDRPPVEWP